MYYIVDLYLFIVRIVTVHKIYIIVYLYRCIKIETGNFARL